MNHKDFEPALDDPSMVAGNEGSSERDEQATLFNPFAFSSSRAKDMATTAGFKLPDDFKRYQVDEPARGHEEDSPANNNNPFVDHKQDSPNETGGFGQYAQFQEEIELLKPEKQINDLASFN